MITMSETASAVCLTHHCHWSASGPHSATAAFVHETETFDHDIRLASGLVGERGTGRPWGNIPEFRGRVEDEEQHHPMGALCRQDDCEEVHYAQSLPSDETQPAEEDAGDVEAPAAFLDRMALVMNDDECERMVRERDAQVRREHGERIAQAIEKQRDHHPLGSHGAQHNNTVDDCARIAREEQWS